MYFGDISGLVHEHCLQLHGAMIILNSHGSQDIKPFKEQELR